MKRRRFLQAASIVPALTALPAVAAPRGKAEHCIFIWLGGGMAQIDTFDPKNLGDNQASPKKAGSLDQSIPTTVPGVSLCEHLSRTAKIMEHVTVMRTVNHHVVDEHAFATNVVHTGRGISGTVTYPSVGSIIAHERGAANPQVPAYILIGYPNVSRGPGFLGPKHGFVYLTDTNPACRVRRCSAMSTMPGPPRAKSCWRRCSGKRADVPRCRTMPKHNARPSGWQARASCGTSI